ncbi:MAG TPA: ATP-binding cassette domain-containing protein [Verrucomicrobiae bacterium]|nr:ATP-binding cassette domain-containing protein [Verrucomicrobiae bacterium]
MQTLVSVKNLRKNYGDHEVLKNVSFEVKKGTVFALLGANGAGKTTTINILSTLLLPSGGELTIGGYDVVRDDQAVRAMISVTGQYAAVDELLTGRENMQMIGRFSHLPEKVIKKRSQEILERLDLIKVANQRAGTYSGGTRRRLDLAISLLAEPPLIFLDEPTTGLDPRSRKAIWELIAELVKGGTTIFLTTQYLEEADQLADTIAVLNDGEIVALGTAEELKQLVGKDMAEMTFRNSSLLKKAMKALGDRVVGSNQPALTLDVTTNGAASDIRELLNQLHAQNAEPQTIHLRKATLDDVFLSLTGTKPQGGDNHAE